MRPRRLGSILGGMLCGLVLAAGRAEAACQISTTSVSFGTYDVFASAPLDSTGTVRYYCEKTDFNVQVRLSRGSSATFDPRTLLKSGEQLQYNLYSDAARTSIWGDGTSGTYVLIVPDPPDKTWVTVTIYARIPAGQDVSAGSYSDTVTATVVW